MKRAGFEPAKQIAKDLQSSSFGRLDTSNKFNFANKNKSCLHVGTRTLNLWFKRPLLYQLSYVINFDWTRPDSNRYLILAKYIFSQLNYAY